MPIIQREVHLINHPDGMPSVTDFAVVESTVAEPAGGEILIKNLYMSVDPAMRPRLAIGQQPLNEAMGGGAIGVVAASRHADFKEGDLVQHQAGFREYWRCDGKHVRRLPHSDTPPTLHMHVLGGTGLDSLWRPARHRRAAARRKRLRLGGGRRGRQRRGADCQDQRLLHDWQRRLAGEMRLVDRRTRCRCSHQLQGRFAAPESQGGRAERHRRVLRERRWRTSRRRTATHESAWPHPGVWHDLRVQHTGRALHRCHDVVEHDLQPADDERLRGVRIRQHPRTVLERHESLDRRWAHEVPRDDRRRHRKRAARPDRAIHRREHRQDAGEARRSGPHGRGYQTAQHHRPLHQAVLRLRLRRLRRQGQRLLLSPAALLQPGARPAGEVGRRSASSSRWSSTRSPTRWSATSRTTCTRAGGAAIR